MSTGSQTFDFGLTRRPRRMPGSNSSLESRVGARITPRPDGCWIYKGGKSSDKYAVVVEAGKRVQAHRWVYELLVGEIPDGHHLHHHCQVPACVNPEHLEPMTAADHRRLHVEIERKERAGR